MSNPTEKIEQVQRGFEILFSKKPSPQEVRREVSAKLDRMAQEEGLDIVWSSLRLFTRTADGSDPIYPRGTTVVGVKFYTQEKK